LIIFDTGILRGCGIEDSRIEVLRAIHKSKVERIGLPWVVLEELAAQHTIKYTEKHDAAVQALGSLANVTPWTLKHTLEEQAADRVRSHWRDRYADVGEEVPTSYEALKTAVSREANALAPAKVQGKAKTNFRDVAIWMSAVEYTRNHADETVYFVCGNTDDFGDGTSYRSPMDQDVAEIRERFVHLTSIEQVLQKFTESAACDEEEIRTLLDGDAYLQLAGEEALRIMSSADGADPAELLGLMMVGYPVASTVRPGWFTAPSAFLDHITDIAAYKIGDQVWCTATARWILCGNGEALKDRQVMQGFMVGVWETRVLFAAQGEPRLSVIKHFPLFKPTEDQRDRLMERSVDNPRVMFQTLGAIMGARFEDPRPASTQAPTKLESLIEATLKDH
jgi:hypothetical protein